MLLKAILKLILISYLLILWGLECIIYSCILLYLWMLEHVKLLLLLLIRLAKHAPIVRIIPHDLLLHVIIVSLVFLVE